MYSHFEGVHVANITPCYFTLREEIISHRVFQNESRNDTAVTCGHNISMTCIHVEDDPTMMLMGYGVRKGHPKTISYLALVVRT